MSPGSMSDVGMGSVVVEDEGTSALLDSWLRTEREVVVLKEDGEM